MPAAPKTLFALALATGLAVVTTTATSALPGVSPWTDIAARGIPLVGPRLTAPLKARTLALDLDRLRATLARSHGLAPGAALPVIRLPRPDGGELEFAVSETQVMAPELAAKYPEIRTYVGRARDNSGITGRFQLDPRGFRAMVNAPEGTYYIDTYSRGDTAHYQAYYAKDLPTKDRAADRVLPRLAPQGLKKGATSGLAGAANKGASISSQLRTYRLALAANYEYSAFHDPATLPAMPRRAVVLAELVNVTNRVSGVYERELGLRLQLVARNDELIFNNRATSPYVDADGTSMLAINGAIIDSIIGNAAYDIGHVTSTGGGGVAGLGVVCNSLVKGRGVTGLSTPVGDDYYIDYVAHEMGHQFGGNHTFNGNAGSCSGNGNADTALEPGSGVTIMAYAGICTAAQNIAPHSIDVFSPASFDEIVAYSRNDEGATCGTASTSTNRPPTVTAPTGGFTIPKQTPFELTGAATDPDNDALAYQWAQVDRGALDGNPDPAANSTTQPLFRDFVPQASPTRVFPQLSDIVGNKHTLGEILSNVGRTLNFRLTVRDNYRVPSAGAPDTNESFERGGVASEDLSFAVSNTAGPFLVTFPNAAGLKFEGKSSQTMTWDVAGTGAAPINCANVELALSTDGGLTYPRVLLASTPNDGTQAVTMPNLDTKTARVRARCGAGPSAAFFDISNNDFELVKVNTAPVAVLSATPTAGTAPVEVTFNGGGSSDPDGDAITAYTFDFGDNSAPVSVAKPSVTHRYASPGTYTATLVVSDGALSSPAVRRVIEVAAAAAVEPFTFARRTGVPLNTFITSDAVTLAGFTGSLPISVAEGTQYSVNGGAFTSAAGSVPAGARLVLRHVSARTAGTETTSRVTVGSYATDFVSVTAAATEDRMPDAFTFGSQQNVPPGTPVTSVEIVLAGYDAPAPIVPGQGVEYSVNGGAFTRLEGSLPVGGKLRARHTSNPASLGYTKTFVTVGGVRGEFLTRTRR